MLTGVIDCINNVECVCIEENNILLIDDIVKGIIEGMVFIIPTSTETEKGNININGLTASHLKHGKYIKYISKIHDNREHYISFTVNLNTMSECSLRFFVYDLLAITDTYGIKVFGTLQKNIMDYIDYVNIQITHKCHGRDINTHLCKCVTDLNGCIIDIECKKLLHTVTKDILSDLIQNNAYDLRSLSCLSFTKNGKLITSLMKDVSFVRNIQ